MFLFIILTLLACIETRETNFKVMSPEVSLVSIHNEIDRVFDFEVDFDFEVENMIHSHVGFDLNHMVRVKTEIDFVFDFNFTVRIKIDFEIEITSDFVFDFSYRVGIKIESQSCSTLTSQGEKEKRKRVPPQQVEGGYIKFLMKRDPPTSFGGSVKTVVEKRTSCHGGGPKIKEKIGDPIKVRGPPFKNFSKFNNPHSSGGLQQNQMTPTWWGHILFNKFNFLYNFFTKVLNMQGTPCSNFRFCKRAFLNKTKIKNHCLFTNGVNETLKFMNKDNENFYRKSFMKIFHDTQKQKSKLVNLNQKNDTQIIELFLTKLFLLNLLSIMVIKILVLTEKSNFFEKSKGCKTIGVVKLTYSSEDKLTSMNQDTLSESNKNWNDWRRFRRKMQLKKGVWSYFDPNLFQVSLSSFYKSQFVQQKRGNDKPLVYLNRLINLRQKVLNAGGSFSEHDLVIHFIATIGKKYDSMMMSSSIG